MNKENIITNFDPFHPFRSEKAKKEFLTCYDAFSKRYPVVSNRRLVDTSYGQTFVQVSGPIDGLPLVLLHGLGATSLSWVANIKAWSQQFKTYAVDNINDYGLSVYTRPITTINELVSWLDELFSALGLEDNINILGMSYGGWLASMYALKYSKRLNKIVLLAPACTVLPVRLVSLLKGFAKTSIFFKPVIGRLPEKVKSWIYRCFGFLLPNRHLTEKLFYWMFGDTMHKDPVGRNLIKDFANMIYVAQRSFKPVLPILPTVLEDKELQSIKVPTLYVVGENEKIYSATKALQRIKEVAPNIKTELVANAGHGLALSHARLINHKVLNFLQ